MPKMIKEQERRKRGNQFYSLLARTIATSDGGRLHGGRPFGIKNARLTLGLRVCVVRVNCGLDNQRLLDHLTAATLPQLVPWKTDLAPVAYCDGRHIVVEAQWPPALERADIQLLDVAPTIDGTCVHLGQTQAGLLITLPAHALEHVLVAGQTGAGKSYTLRSMIYQLSANTDGLPNRVVLVDGKGGEGLGIVNGTSGQVGPLAIDEQSTIDALGWAISEIRRRYEIIRASGGYALNGDMRHIFVIFDEPQTYTKRGRVPAIVEQVNILATQGRAAGVHLVIGTQKPLVSSFGDSTTADQFSVAVGGRVKSHHTSRVIMGDSTPRCDHLLSGGDAYVKATVPQMLIERVQMAYVPEPELARVAGGQPKLGRWPEFDTEELEHHDGRGRPRKCTSPIELAVGIEAQVRSEKRQWFKNALGDDAPGSGRATRIMRKCANVLAHIKDRGGKVTFEK